MNQDGTKLDWSALDRAERRAGSWTRSRTCFPYLVGGDLRMGLADPAATRRPMGEHGRRDEGIDARVPCRVLRGPPRTADGSTCRPRRRRALPRRDAAAPAASADAAAARLTAGYHCVSVGSERLGPRAVAVGDQVQRVLPRDLLHVEARALRGRRGRRPRISRGVDADRSRERCAERSASTYVRPSSGMRRARRHRPRERSAVGVDALGRPQRRPSGRSRSARSR